MDATQDVYIRDDLAVERQILNLVNSVEEFQLRIETAADVIRPSKCGSQRYFFALLWYVDTYKEKISCFCKNVSTNRFPTPIFIPFQYVLSIRKHTV